MENKYYPPSDSYELYCIETDTWFNKFNQVIRNPEEYDDSEEGYTPFGDE